MTITNTWNISNLERNVSDGKVTVVHYTISADDGTYSTGAYGSIGVDGDISTPFKDLKPGQVIGWVHDALGDEQVAAIEEALAKQLAEMSAPTVAAGVPW